MLEEDELRKQYREQTLSYQIGLLEERWNRILVEPIVGLFTKALLVVFNALNRLFDHINWDK